MPYVLLSGFGADDDDLDVLATVAALLDHGERIVVDDGVLLVPATDRAALRREQARRRQQKKRRASRRERDTRHAESVTHPAEFSTDDRGVNPLSALEGLEREGYPGERHASVTRDASVTRNGVTRDAAERDTGADPYAATSPRADAGRWQLPPMTDDERAANRDAAAEIRERMRRGEL